MSDNFLGEIRITANNFAPQGWAMCNGQLMSISQNTPLFSLLGTSYGGDGRTTFALPDMRGRVPIHMSANYPLSQSGGEREHTLTQAEIPAHSHTVYGVPVPANSGVPNGALLGAKGRLGHDIMGTSANTSLAVSAVSYGGGNQGHPNMQPFLTLNFIIALTGNFPSRN